MKLPRRLARWGTGGHDGRCSPRGTTPSLAVRFRTWFGPLIPVPKAGNYWVLHVDDLYQEAIVGTPNRKYLWLLARTATIPGPRYAALVAKAEGLGYDVSRLIRTSPQSAAEFPTQP